jgi:hypothetical protein
MLAGSVYRHLEQEFVRKFFKSGELRLTTLPKCRAHDDRARKDALDGKVNFSVREGDQMLAGIRVAGKRSFLLCASRSTASEVQDHFKTDSWIEIINVRGFADAVGKVVQATGKAQIDDCRYVQPKEVNEVAASQIINEYMAQLYEASETPGADIHAASDALNEQIGRIIESSVGDDVYFMKNREPFAVEEEVRFVWLVDYDVAGPDTFFVPDAVQFCKRGPLT